MRSRCLGDAQVGGRDRVAVRVVGREAELAVDARLELLREHVLEPFGLLVDVVDRDAELLGQELLEQPVVPDHLDRGPLALLRERDAAVALVRARARGPRAS